VDSKGQLSNLRCDWISQTHSFRLKDYGLTDLRDTAQCLVARFNRETSELELVGTSPSLKAADLVIKTQFEYMQRHVALLQNEREVRQQLSAMRRPYSMRPSRDEQPERARERPGRRGEEHDTEDREPATIQNATNSARAMVRA
jgi:hypothetical protein